MTSDTLLGLLAGRVRGKREQQEAALMSRGLDPLLAQSAASTRRPVRDFFRSFVESPDARAYSDELAARRLLLLQDSLGLGNGSPYYSPQPQPQPDQGGGLVDAALLPPAVYERRPAPQSTRDLQPRRPGPSPQAPPPRPAAPAPAALTPEQEDRLLAALDAARKKRAAQTFDEPFNP